MHIIIAHSRLDTLGGGERATLELARHLGQRHEVTLWAGHFDAARTFPSLADYPRRDLSPLAWLYAWPRADVVIAQTFGAGLLALRFPRVVRYLHTMRSAYLRGGVRPGLLARRALDRHATRRAAVVLANSAFAARRARRHYGRAVAVVPPGVDAALFSVAQQPGTYALYVGRLAPEKGLERLIAWHAQVATDLVIVGTGAPDYEARLRAGAGSRVRFVGPLVGAALVDAYAGCRYLAFLPYAEEFGLAVLEAMAAGKPVVSSDEGGPADLVRDGVSGYLVHDATAFDAACRRLLHDDAICQRMGRAGRTSARAYTWHAYAERLEAVCEAVCHGFHQKPRVRFRALQT